jgi:hypothetical protein
MSEIEGSGGGRVGKVWRKHGGGYYALLAVGTFVYLEIQALTSSFLESEGVRDFVSSEILEAIFTFGLKTIINSFMAGIWPFVWAGNMGLTMTAAWAGGGYLVWSVILAALLARRENEYKKELGL